MAQVTLRRVLVPLDGSRLAEQALPVAAAIARRTGAALHLVSVVSGHANAQHREALERVRRYLAATAEGLATCHGLEGSCTLLEGAADAALAEFARARGISLVVMTTHGRSGFSRYWLGSVAVGLLHRISVPVLLLHAGAAFQHIEFESPLVALDGSPNGEAVLEAVMSLGIVSKGATVTLAHAVEHPVPLFVAPTLEAVPCDARAVEEWCAAADAYLTGVGPRVRAGGMNVRTRVQVGANVAAQLLELARSGAHDLVAVGMRSGRGLQRLILGSVADKVVRAAEQPVLVVPVPREDGGRVEPAAGSAAEAPRPASVEAA